MLAVDRRCCRTSADECIQRHPGAQLRNAAGSERRSARYPVEMIATWRSVRVRSMRTPVPRGPSPISLGRTAWFSCARRGRWAATHVRRAIRSETQTRLWPIFARADLRRRRYHTHVALPALKTAKARQTNRSQGLTSANSPGAEGLDGARHATQFRQPLEPPDAGVPGLTFLPMSPSAVHTAYGAAKD